MSNAAQAFFFALGTYLATFNASPPHSFINDNTISLQMKITRMTDSINQKSKILT